MKKLLLPVFALMAISAGSAVAADLPRKAPAMVAAPPPMASWTGCYVGAGGGYGMFNNDTHTVFDPGGGLFGIHPVTHGGRGWFGTVQVGCDLQIGGRWVIGAFGDYDWADLSGDHVSFFGAGGENRLDNSWSVGGRIGWLVFPQLLTYVSAGYTEAEFEQIDLRFFGVGTPTFSIAGRTHEGWFLGGGVEYAIGWLPGLYWKTEYRVAEYDSATTPINLFGTNISSGFAEVHETYVQTVRSQLVWRWNWGGGRW